MTEIAIRNVDDLKDMARTMGTSALLPDSLRGKPADVFVTILYGHELGLSPMASIQGIYVVKGKPMMAAQTWLALARRAGHRVNVSEHTDESCTVNLVRGDTGETHTSTYTMAEAQAAGLTRNDTWTKHPRRMLLARAVANGCRFLCPEIALGALVEGEGDDVIGDGPEPITEAQPPAEADVVDAEIVEPAAAAQAVADIAAEYEQTGPDLFEEAGDADNR